jgi:DnaT-like ssDNA binding protein
MALIVETGAGIAGANTYLSAADALAIFSSTDRPTQNTAWTAVSLEKRVEALLYAARWLDGRYRESLSGGIVSTTQTLIWPRSSFYDSAGRLVTTGTIPDVWKEAQAEAALAHLTTGLNEVRNRGGAIEAITAGSVSVRWSSGAPAGRTVPYIDDLVAPLLEFGLGRRLVRA